MGKFISYCSEEIEFNNCPSCDFNNHLFSLPCGIIHEDDMLVLAQDWELPIPGFLIVAPRRHVENFCDLTNEERNQMFEVVDKAIRILKQKNICEKFNVIFEEKTGNHFHIWIMPRHNWMIKEFSNPTKRIADVFKFAKENLRTVENLKYVDAVNNIVRDNWIK
jgi:diadenosine tetraphosphate (Ap4A) HIT family hydrolase